MSVSLGFHELGAVKGSVIRRGTPEYKDAVKQYAYSSHTKDMDPACVVYAEDEADIQEVLKFAASQKDVPVAVRTGGHQYSGSSSTSGKGILLDLSETFQTFDAKEDGKVTMGISFRLAELNGRLAEHGLFVPHGQCAHVHAGGHAHTGGYGNSCRGFGLFGDHITAIKVITADGVSRWIERGTSVEEERDLFWAVLGGSPGNFAILTHIKLQARLSRDHPHARGLRMVLPYREDAMRTLLQVKADMAAVAGDPKLPAWRCRQDLPPDFDMCITVLAIDLPEWDLPSLFRKFFITPKSLDPGSLLPSLPEGAVPFYEKIGVTKEEFEEFAEQCNRHGEARGLPLQVKPGYIVLWAQWANVNGKPENEQAVPPEPWFKALLAAGEGIPKLVWDWRKGHDGSEGLSFLTGQWTWPIKREFVWPYNKRTYCTNSTTLNTSGWVDDMLERMGAALDGWWLHGARLVMQVFHFGGPQAAFITNEARHDTAYSWRDDTTVQLVMDCFYLPDLPFRAGQKFADEWQKKNDVVFKGPGSSFASNMDRRVLWGSYAANDAEKSLDATWQYYFEDEAKYERLRAIKTRVDPGNLLTPNAFAIHAVSPAPGAEAQQ